MKISISIADDLCEKIDARAKALYVSRSAYITMALLQKMQMEDALVFMPQLTSAITGATAVLQDKEPDKGQMTLDV